MNTYKNIVGVLEKISQHRDTLIYLIASFGGAAIGFFLFPIYTGPLNLTPEDFGIIGYTQSINSFIGPVLQLSFSTYYIKMYFEKSTQSRPLLLGSIVLFLFLWSLVLLILFAIVGAIVFAFFEIKVSFYPYMFWMLVSNLFSCFYIFLLLQNRMERKPIHYLLNTFLNTFLVLGLPMVVIWLWVPGAEGRILGYCLGALLSGFISFFLLRNKITISIDFGIIKSAWKFSAPLIPYVLIMLFYDTLDRFYVEKYFSGLTDLGFYNVAMQFSTISYMVATAYYRATEADYFELATENKLGSMYRKMSHATWFYLIMSVLVLLFSGILIQLLTNEKFAPSVPIIKILVIAVFIQSCNLLVFTFLTIKSRTKEMLYISIGGLIVYIVAINFLGEELGIKGVAWAKTILHGSILALALFCIKDSKGKARLIVPISIGIGILVVLYILT